MPQEITGGADIMKYLIGLVVGIILTISSLYLYRVYYETYVRAHEYLYWYVSCLAEQATEEGAKKSDPFRVCGISKEQIKKIADRYN